MTEMCKVSYMDVSATEYGRILCIEIIVSHNFRYLVGPNAVTFQSQRRPKIVILHLQSLNKVPKKVLL